MSILENKTNENPRKVLKKSGSVYITASKNDSYAATSPIPQSDYQYTWITSSVLSDKRVFLNSGYLTSSDWLSGNQVLSGSRIIEEINTDNTGLPKSISKPSNNLRLPDGEDGDYGPYSSPNQWLSDDSLSTKIENYLVSPLDLVGGEFDNLRSLESVPLMNSLYLYGLNGADGWGTRKNIRNGDHPVARYYKRRSRIIVMDEPRTITTTDGRQVKEKRNPNQAEYHEPYINASQLPVKHKIDQITDDITGRVDTVTLKYTLANNNEFFSNKALNRRLDASTDETNFYDTISQQYLNDATEQTPVVNFRSLEYSQVIWPRAENMFLSKIRDRADFYFPWKDDRSERNVDNYVNAMGETIDEASIWVLDARDNFLSRSAIDYDYGVGELQSTRAYYDDNRNGPNQRYLQYFYRTEESGSDLGLVFAGETKFEAGDQAGTQPFEQNYRKFVNKIRHSAKEYSLIPEFRISEHISEYVDDLGGNFLADNSSLFSITGAANFDLSDSDFYRVFNTSDLLSSDFTKIKSDHENLASATRLRLKASGFLTFLPYEGLYPAQRTVEIGTLFSESYGNNIIYSGSGDTDFNTEAKWSNYKIINQIFYAPGLMYNTIKSGIAVDFTVITGSDGTEIVTNDYGGGPLPLFNRYTEPNYRYVTMPNRNSVIAGAGSWYKVPFEALLNPESYLQGLKLRDMDPSVYSALYPPSGETPGAYATLGSSEKLSYKLAVNNFLAEVPSFFLKSQNFSNIVSADDNDPNYFNFDLDKEYRARVYLRASKYYDDYEVFRRAVDDGAGVVDSRTSYTVSEDDWFIYTGMAIAISGSKKYTEPNFVMYDRPNFNYEDMSEVYGTETANFGLGTGDVFTDSGSYDHGGSAFGGNKWAAGGSFAQVREDPAWFLINNNAVYDSHTPPYYDGYAYVDLIYRPKLEDGTVSSVDNKKVRVDLNTLTSNLTASYYRYSTNALADYITSNSPDNPLGLFSFNTLSGSAALIACYKNQESNMQIDASLNIFGRIKNKSVEYSPDGESLSVRDDAASGESLVIYPKFETPIYDYRNVDYEIPNYGQHSVATGMWHQYGADIEPGKGLIMQVQDFPSTYIRKPIDDDITIEFEVVNTNRQITGSLADAIGLPKDAVTLGQTAQKKTVSEAIVLVPFVETRSNKKFFAINEEKMQTSTVQRMLAAMDKYVIPPQFNFKLYDGQNNKELIEPFLMYFLEFSYDLDREDLKRIWHNLPPKISAGLVEKEVEIGQELLESEALSDYSENLKWLVFKVKQKGEKSYFRKTFDSRDDARFKFDFNGNGILTEPDYSYNWPYDYFSLVEMAKIQVDVLFETPEEATRRRNLENNPELVRMPTSVREDVDIRENIRPPDTAPTTQQAQTTSTIRSTQGIRDFLNNED